MRIQRPVAGTYTEQITLRVYGEPKPAGSKSAGVAYRKDGAGNRVPVLTERGTIRTFVKDSSGEPGRVWRNQVAGMAAEGWAGRPLLDCPLYVEMTFFVARSKGHFGSGRNAGRLRASAPAFPATRPDVLKLARAVEDALTNVLWRDDARIVCGPNEKVFAGPSEPIGVEVRVWTLPATVGEMEVAGVGEGISVEPTKFLPAAPSLLD